MKAKLSLDKNAIQTFFLENVEKIVLGGVVVCFLLMAYVSVGRERFDKRAKDLIDSAGNAERHWADTKVEENEDVKLIIKPTDYSAIASRSRVELKAAPYQQPVAWNRPVFEQLPPRGEAPTFAVEEIRATVGRGPLQRATGGEGPRGIAVGAAAKGHRWVALIGAVPLKKQADAFKKAYENCLVPKPENNTPHYRLWYIQRVEVTGRGATDNLKWDEPPPVDFAAARKKAQDTLGKGVADPLDAAVMDQRYVEREAVFDLPLRGDRQSWEAKIVRHPRIVGPAFEDVRIDPKSFEGQKVTWQGEVLFSTASDSRIEGARAVYSIRKVSERGGPAPAIDNECFAVDYATAEAAKATGRGVVTAIVKGKATVNIPIADAKVKQATRPVTMPLLQDAGAPSERGGGTAEPTIDPVTGEPIAAGEPGGRTKPAPTRPAGGREKTDEVPDYQLFRFLDFEVLPGKLYRYRVQALLKNPNYGVETQALEKPELGEKPWIRTGWSEPSDVVAVPVDTRLLAGPVTPPTRIIGEPTCRIKIRKWVESNGIEASKEFTCFRGTVADYPNCTWPEGRAPAKPGKKDDSADTRGAPAAASRITPFRVDYLTGDVLLDMRGERIARSLTERAGPGELLTLDADGNLRVYNELEGLQDYEEPESGDGDTPGTGGPAETPGGEGLDFGDSRK